MESHPFWPEYWENLSPIVHDNDYATGWGFDVNGDLCWDDTLGSGRPHWVVSCQIISVTLLPDDLLWLRVIHCPSYFDGIPSDGGHVGYRLMSVPIYERYAANRVKAVAWTGKRWASSTRYRWAAQMKFDTYVPPDPEVFKRIAEALAHAFAEGETYPPA